MSHKKSQMIQGLLEIDKLFKEGKLQEVSVELDRYDWHSCSRFYSLYARVKYIRSVVFRRKSDLHQLWFQESTICLSPNYLPYIPDTFFDEWLNSFYDVSKETHERWIPQNTKLNVQDYKHPEATFLKVDGSFLKRFVFESEPIEVEVRMSSTLPKAIPDATVAVQIKDTNNNTKLYTIAKHQSITPNKTLIFKSAIQPEANVTNLKLTDVVLIINGVLLIFQAQSNSEIHIEPRDSGCSLTANLPPTGFVDVPAPIHLKFTTSEAAGYSVILSVFCQNAIVAPVPEMTGDMKNIKIDVDEPYREYNITFYVFSSLPNEINIQLKWHVQKDGKSGRIVKQELPLEFQLPFLVETEIYNETRTLVPQGTPLLTESSYSILTKFSVNSSWPVSIESFEIIPTTENINFHKSIIRLPIALEPNDEFSALTRFSTGSKEEKTSLGKLQIRYFMNSAVYEGSHVYSYILPATDSHQIAIDTLKLRVKFDFPPRGSQFEMCELCIHVTNVSYTPIEIVLYTRDTSVFFMAGTLNTQIGLFPNDPIELPLKFFPLAHGSLTFPEISINSAQNFNHCYWKASPTIFISYPAAS
ncbi:hypothetical protein TRFO_10751 [Tritrichomonas foetus]|uniref:Trafficking protein particle complex subunit 11 C-terminal domain-containing protein n=1 Tax=Tritrichomonas foetus TaxID=1144522 RepID=A0A1J4J730_9EUKA|nr:hypothetical protein TRFO_10751 [Tritrichomonas foetus]|eukprot:OHS95034.1 hypothetical protein TRFO_10751 [Tritrichomonas foetus]